MTIRWPALSDWPPDVRIGFTERGSVGDGDAALEFNLAAHVGDDATRVAENRLTLERALPQPTKLVWMDQVHGSGVSYADPQRPEPATADALWSDQPGVCCCVLTADCLPILLCDRRGTRIAAVHAGWRGLAAGVLEATLERMVDPGVEILAWLGPAIGPDAFEVGPDVRQAYAQMLVGESQRLTAKLFRPSPSRPGHYLADLRGLATLRLKSLGVRHISGVPACTYSDPERFFSYRRDGQTGRMASFIVRYAPS